MDLVFNTVLEALLAERESFNQIWFAGDKVTPPACCYQVNFPRLELVISGEYRNQISPYSLTSSADRKSVV